MIQMKSFLRVDGRYYEGPRKLFGSDIEVPERPTELHIWDKENSKWAIVLSEYKIVKETEIREEGERRLLALSAPYGRSEKDTWFKQEREARAWLLDNASPTPMLSAISNARGITLEDLISKVMENTNLFETISGTILGQQQALLDRLNNASTEEEILSIGWT